MRHKKTGRKLGREWDQRKALMRNLAKSLVTHGKIRTTVAKAKELRRVADKLVSLALRNDVHARRQAFKVLNNHQLVQKLFDEIGPNFVGVAGGYTRVVKLGLPRKGDSAPMAMIEFSRTAADEAPAAKEKKAKKAAPKAEAKVEAPKAEEAAPEAPAEEAKAEEAAPEEAPAEEAAPEAAPEAAEEAPAEEAAPEAGEADKEDK